MAKQFSLGDPVVALKVEPEPTDGSPSQDDNGALEVKSERFDDCSSQDRSTPILRTLAFTKKSLQQHKRSRSVKLKDCKQKCRRGQHFTMPKRNLTAEMVLELLDSEHILDTDEESGCSELDHQDNKLDADIAHPSPQYLQTTLASEDVQLLESCSGEDSAPESEEEPGDNAQETIRTSRNGTNWGENPPLQQRTPRHNIMRNPPGPAPGNTPRSPKHAWDLFVTDNMLEEICKCSNLEGQRAAANKKKVWKDISKNELLAFLGVSLLAGYDKSCDVSIRELFGDRVSNPMYRATMPPPQASHDVESHK
uniref:PiggyBac transposable element-derived protein domain-containing protein n=1 Tax=Eptatretus burgeri TaxID=7764 RepID=A0A8C4NHB4_EPTBU